MWMAKIRPASEKFSDEEFVYQIAAFAKAASDALGGVDTKAGIGRFTCPICNGYAVGFFAKRPGSCGDRVRLSGRCELCGIRVDINKDTERRERGGRWGSV